MLAVIFIGVLLLVVIAWVVSDSGKSIAQFLGVCLMIGAIFIMMTAMLFLMQFYVCNLTVMYLRYQSEGEWDYRKRKNRKSPLVIAYVCVCVACAGMFSILVYAFDDEIFPVEVTTGVIAHRAGGFEAAENTVAGVNKAYELGAEGSETDIQRTADGYYVINHDESIAHSGGSPKAFRDDVR
ncbi:MAG: hypothetical protein IJH96_03475 [Ruminococcus sp.]|nr:hypothetical protein [Ruminococcus sp.]